MNNVSTIQWRRILQNINRVLTDRRNFMRERELALEATVRDFNQMRAAAGVRSNVNLMMVFDEIRQALERGQNVTNLPSPNILKDVYLKDQAIHEQRERQMDALYRRWQQEYLRCEAGQSQVQLLQDVPVFNQNNPVEVPSRGGQGQGQGQGLERQSGGIGTAGGVQMGSRSRSSGGRTQVGQSRSQGMSQGASQGRGQVRGQSRMMNQGR
jgi:hypothetical protein